MRTLLALLFTLSLATMVSCGDDDSSSSGPSETVATLDAGSPSDDVTTPDTAEDVGPPDSEGCHTNAECADSGSEFGMRCSTPYDPYVCGIAPMQECWSNQDCLGIGPAGANLICHAIQDDCSSDGIGSLCDMSCADSPDICGDKGALVCGDEGACEPRSCLDGQECHAVQLCDPAAGSAGPHGCSFVTCQAGTDCAAGLYCVKSMCIEMLGTCVEDLPVP